MHSSSADPYAGLRRRRLAARFGVAALLAGAGWYLWASTREPTGLDGAIAAIVHDAMEEGPIAGVSVGVARGGRVIHAAGYGFADVENDVPATAATVYHVGSITKQFTAAAIMQLVEKGLVRLDEPISTYLPGLPVGDAVTVRSLLTHTAGVRNFTTMESWWETVGVEMSPEELVEVFAREPLDFEPGSAFSYSNSGYVLLGRIIERVSGQPYGGYLNTHLFVPLDLPRTSYCDDRALVADRARGYQLADAEFTNAGYVSLSQAYAAGGICSSVGDLLRWIRLLSNGAVVDPSSYAMMVEPATLSSGRPIEYGFGLALGYVDGHQRVAHVGGMRGFAGYMAYYPDDDLRVVVLTNTEGAAAADVATRIARLILGLAPPTTRDIALSPNELEAYTGTYDMKLTEVSVRARDGHLHAEVPVPGIEDADLLYQGENTFQAAGDPQTTVTFEMREGRAVGFVLRHQGITLRGERVGEEG